MPLLLTFTVPEIQNKMQTTGQFDYYLDIRNYLKLIGVLTVYNSLLCYRFP